MSEELMKVKDIVEVLEVMVPPALQEEWDNSGLQIGFAEAPVKRVMTCLEVNMDVVREAIDCGAEMIISHHPLIFGGVRSVVDGDPKGAMLLELARAGISVYSTHTPFDKVNGGNNDALAKLIGLNKITDLGGAPVAKPEKMIASPSEMHIGRMGNLKKEMKFSQVIDMVCEILGLKPGQVRAVGSLDAEITKVGLCTGSGSEFIGVAAAAGCQLFITGDVKYHIAQDAREMGICLLDAGHYGTEKIFPAVMKVQLDKVIGADVDVVVSKENLDPFVVL